MNNETQASAPTPTAGDDRTSAQREQVAAAAKAEASVRTAMIAGWFGIAGTLLTCIITWGLNRIDKSPPTPAPVPTSVPAPTSAGSAPTVGTATVAAVDLRAAAAARPRHEELLRQSPISFADWQALVRDRLSVAQRRAVFGGEVGKRVTWEGVFDQYNLMTARPITANDAYLLVMFENEAARQATPLRPAPALCHFPALAKRQLSELRPGQRIVISGTLSNPDLAGQLLGTELQACEIVATIDAP